MCRVPGGLLHEGAVWKAAPVFSTLDDWSGNSLLRPHAAVCRTEPALSAVHQQICQRSSTGANARPVGHIPASAGNVDPSGWYQH